MMTKHPFSEGGLTGLRAAADIESRGAPWADASDAYLVGFVTEQQPIFHTPALVEMDRRVIVAIHQFNEQSKRQTDALIQLSHDSGAQNATMIRLTRWIIALTVALGVIAVFQVWVALNGALL